MAERQSSLAAFIVTKKPCFGLSHTKNTINCSIGLDIENNIYSLICRVTSFTQLVLQFLKVNQFLFAFHCCILGTLV